MDNIDPRISQEVALWPTPQRSIVRIKMDGYLPYRQVDELFRVALRSMEKTLNLEVPVQKNTLDLDKTEDKEFWVAGFAIDYRENKDVDDALFKFLEEEPVFLDGYTTELLSDEEKLKVYSHFKQEAATLPMSEVFSWVKPAKAKLANNADFAEPFLPFPKTYKMVKGIKEDWLTQYGGYKSVAARDAIMNHRFDDYAKHLQQITGQDLSKVSKSWVLKAFNIPFKDPSSPESNWSVQDYDFEYLNAVQSILYGGEV